MSKPSEVPMDEPVVDDELRSLLSGLKAVPPVSAERRASVLERIHSVVDVADVAGAPAPRAPDSRWSAAANTAISLLAGIAIGAVGSHYLRRDTSGVANTTVEQHQSEHTPEPDSAEMRHEVETQEAPSHSPTAVEVPRPEAPTQRLSEAEEEPVRAREATRPGSLADERRLIEAAFSALRSGAPDDARRILDRHAERYEDGVLAGERERIRSLLHRAHPPSEAD